MTAADESAYRHSFAIDLAAAGVAHQARCPAKNCLLAVSWLSLQRVTGHSVHRQRSKRPKVRGSKFLGLCIIRQLAPSGYSFAQVADRAVLELMKAAAVTFARMSSTTMLDDRLNVLLYIQNTI